MPGSAFFFRSLVGCCISFSTLVRRGSSLSDSIEISRSVMNNKIQTTNNPKDVSTNTLNIFDDRYYSVNKRMLSFLGLWPYQSNLEKRIKFVLLLLISFSVMVVQFRAMIFTWGRLDTFVECFSPLGTNIACDIKLINIMLQQRKVRKTKTVLEHNPLQPYRLKLRNLVDRMQQDWESMRNLKQLDVIKECAENARRWSILWVSMIYSVVCGWLIMATTPRILDIVKPLNYTRKSFDIMLVDYGVDTAKYWWLIQMHVYPSTMVVVLIMPAFDALYMSFAQHACGMLKILRHKLENIFENGDNINVTLKPNYHEDHYYQEIVACIKQHRYLVRYIRDMESTYEMCLFIILGINMIGLSITCYQAVAEGTPLETTVRYALFTIVILTHLFVTTLPGHWIMSCSALFPDSAYYSKWYMMSLRSRKLIILIIRASIKPCSITAGKLYVLSMSNFCSVLKTSMSYLTMLTSMQ